MSRIIVKNLPKVIKQEKLAELFGSHGEITDLRMCKTSSGDFRKFAFVGFKTEEQAANALKFFNKSYINTSKILVEIAKNIGDETVPRPWSKYSNRSSAFSRLSKEKHERKQRIKELQGEKPEISTDKTATVEKPRKEDTILQEEELDKLNIDQNLNEFLMAHDKKASKNTWSNEIATLDSGVVNKKNLLDNNKQNPSKKKSKTSGSSSVNKNNENTSEEECSDIEEKGDDEPIDHASSEEPNKNASDLDWLKSKAASNEVEKDEEDEVEKDTDDDEKDTDDDEKDTDDDEEMEKLSDSSNIEASAKTKYMPGAKWSLSIKMRGIPFKCTEKQIIAFFSPIKVEDIRMPMDDKKKARGVAYVDFENEDEVQEAMKRHKKSIKDRYIELFRIQQDGSFADSSLVQEKNFPWQNKKPLEGEEEESAADSGRLFIRNLSYTCTETDIKELFEEFGPTAEVHLPIDKTTKRTTGIGFVTYVMPEHAVKALNALDGVVFQGRLLHVISARSKRASPDAHVDKSMSAYKKESDAKKKSLSASGHNWNTLFLGQNAIVDSIAEKTNAQKSDILESDHSGSLAVRMALGETQIVAETREFLTSYGVKLDVFGQANVKKSTTVMLVKNLPHGTNTEELRSTFGKFGDIDRVLLPPSGVSGIVEFLQPTEARIAFRSLAYSKFKHVPLYLEWAPLDVFSGEQTAGKAEEEEKNKSDTEEDVQDASEDAVGNGGRVLFVKNLNFTTTEDKLRTTFEKCGKLLSVTIARKKDPKRASENLSMGYAFLEFAKSSYADEAIKTMQHVTLEDHELEVKKSHRNVHESKTAKSKSISKKQTSSKLLVRNIPFEATRKEIQQLFSAYGEIKTVRLPKKVAGSHRGFAFVDFLSKQDAKRAFKALCQSTHLYGRRLVLEWAEAEETVDSIRQRTALHFHGEPLSKKRKSEMLDTLDNTTTTAS